MKSQLLAITIFSSFMSMIVLADDLSPNTQEYNPPSTANNKTIQSSVANGEKQTTIIDANGNLKMIDKSQTAHPAMPSSHPTTGVPASSANSQAIVPGGPLSTKQLPEAPPTTPHMPPLTQGVPPSTQGMSPSNTTNSQLLPQSPGGNMQTTPNAPTQPMPSATNK